MLQELGDQALFEIIHETIYVLVCVFLNKFRVTRFWADGFWESEFRVIVYERIYSNKVQP